MIYGLLGAVGPWARGPMELCCEVSATLRLSSRGAPVEPSTHGALDPWARGAVGPWTRAMLGGLVCRPSTNRFIVNVASGSHFPGPGPGRARPRIYIYSGSGLRTPFPKRWPRQGPSTNESIVKVASGRHFPGGGPGRARPRKDL